MRRAMWFALIWAVGCSVSEEKPADDTAQTTTTELSDTAGGVGDLCVTPSPSDLLYPPYPEVPADCVADFWDCPLEPDYATQTPTTVCNITEGFDPTGTIQEQFWSLQPQGLPALTVPLCSIWSPGKGNHTTWSCGTAARDRGRVLR